MRCEVEGVYIWTGTIYLYTSIQSSTESRCLRYDSPLFTLYSFWLTTPKVCHRAIRRSVTFWSTTWTKRPPRSSSSALFGSTVHQGLQQSWRSYDFQLLRGSRSTLAWKTIRVGRDISNHTVWGRNKGRGVFAHTLSRSDINLLQNMQVKYREEPDQVGRLHLLPSEQAGRFNFAVSLGIGSSGGDSVDRFRRQFPWGKDMIEYRRKSPFRPLALQWRS